MDQAVGQRRGHHAVLQGVLRREPFDLGQAQGQRGIRLVGERQQEAADGVGFHPGGVTLDDPHGVLVAVVEQ
ncbi:hypothetical protein D9M68_705700 [compost metagenome]